MLLQGTTRGLSEVADDHIDMTPMCDVVFQLLTFLLLTYLPAGSAELEIPKARHGVGVDESDAILISIARPESPGAPARVFDGGNADPARALTTAEAIEEAVRRGRNEGRTRIVLQADGGVPHGEVLRVASAASQVEGVTLHIGVQEPD
jgi:biopolymer transport protein ExbD